MDEHESRQIHDKVVQIFSEIVPERSERLDFFKDNDHATDAIAVALAEDTPRHEEMAFHLSDIRTDAAFLVALHLFPERFTPQEISAGVWQFMAHVPYHIKMAIETADMQFEEDFGCNGLLRMQTNKAEQNGAPNP